MVAAHIQHPRASRTCASTRPNTRHACKSHATYSYQDPAAATSYSANGHRQLESANFPVDQDGRTYHVGTKRGEVANRILCVGSVRRARLLSLLLRPPSGQVALRTVESSRGFVTVTGEWKGFPVSIVTHLMGFGNLDMFLREVRAVATPPLLVIRMGTCGSLNNRVGQLHIPSEGAVALLRNPDAFHPDATNGATAEPYRITRPVQPDAALTEALRREAAELFEPGGVHMGMNASADSFYSSQGRMDANFDDRNAMILHELMSKHPSVSSMEMETFHLLHLANCSYGDIRATAGALALACRLSDDWLDQRMLEQLELRAGKAALNALVTTSDTPPRTDRL